MRLSLISFLETYKGNSFWCYRGSKRAGQETRGFRRKDNHWGGGISCLTCAGNCYEAEDRCQKERESERAFVRLGP
jgi:hypothetical protein